MSRPVKIIAAILGMVKLNIVFVAASCFFFSFMFFSSASCFLFKMAWSRHSMKQELGSPWKLWRKSNIGKISVSDNESRDGHAGILA